MIQHRCARAAVFSAGSWGTAVAKIMADAGTDVIVHARRAEIADAINTTHRNADYFPDVDLPETLRPRPTRPPRWRMRTSLCCPSPRSSFGRAWPRGRRTSGATPSSCP